MPRPLPVPATPDEWRAVAALIDRYGLEPSAARERVAGRDRRLGDRTVREVLRDPGGLAAVLAAFAAEAAELGLAALGAGTAGELARRLATEPATDDPIVAEVRAAREALFAEAGYDLEELFRRIQASEAADGLGSAVRPMRAP